MLGDTEGDGRSAPEPRDYNLGNRRHSEEGKGRGEPSRRAVAGGREEHKETHRISPESPFRGDNPEPNLVLQNTINVSVSSVEARQPEVFSK